MNDYVGRQFGNYRLIRLLGQGGFADVYLGEHVYLKTQAAIKLLQTRLALDDLEVFLKEARTVSNLIHPHIVRVLEFGVEGKTPYLVMDYAANGTLRQRHPKGTRLAPATIIPYVKQVASALQYAHDKKLIHRDVKPENMLVGQNNDILLSDFGIALVSQSSRYQSTQEVAGTLAYMAPEQFHGKPVAASDQYALGIVVYEWLTGERPFHGSFAEIASQHVLAPPTLLREKIPEITPAIEEVVHRALAKEPQQRFLRVEAFANALEQACFANFVMNQPGQTPQRLFMGQPPQQPFMGQPPQQPFMGQPPNRPSSPNFGVVPPPQEPSPDYGAVPQRQFSPLPPGNQPVQSSPSYAAISLNQSSDTTFVPPQRQGSSPSAASAPPDQPWQSASSTSSSPNTPKQPKRGISRRGVLVGLAGVTGIIVVGGAATLFALSQKGPATTTLTPTSNTATNVALATSTSTTEATTPGSGGASSPTVNSSPTVAATPGTVLYTADWSGGLNGWAGSPDWKVLNGALLNDGTAGNTAAGPTIVPPYQLGNIADYAMETTIQVVSYQNGYSPQFGLALRGSIVSNNWQGYLTSIANLDANNYGGVCYVLITTEDNGNQLTKTPFDPGKSTHTYRFEAKGNKLRFFIDGGNVLEVTDNRYLMGSQLGLWSYHAQLSVTNFKIIAL